MAVLTRVRLDSALVQRPEVLRLEKDGKLAETTLSRLRVALGAIVDRLNGLLSLGTAKPGTWAGNIDGQYLEVVAREANVEFPIPHGLGRVPVAYATVRTNGASLLYDNGGGNWTDSTLYLKATDAGTVFRILVW